MSQPISKSEAQFKLRNIQGKIGVAQSAAKEGDWQIVFDNAYEAQDMLTILLPWLEELVEFQRQPRKEPVGSLKYINQDGTPTGAPIEAPSKKKERIGGLGYRGSSQNRGAVPEPRRVNDPVQAWRDQRTAGLAPPPVITNLPKVTPPAPTIVTPPPPPKVGDWVQWESQGMLLMPKAAQIERFSEDGQYAFFAHSPTGVPVGQLIPALPEEEVK